MATSLRHIWVHSVNCVWDAYNAFALVGLSVDRYQNSKEAGRLARKVRCIACGIFRRGFLLLILPAVGGAGLWCLSSYIRHSVDLRDKARAINSGLPELWTQLSSNRTD